MIRKCIAAAAIVGVLIGTGATAASADYVRPGPVWTGIVSSANRPPTYPIYRS